MCWVAVKAGEPGFDLAIDLICCSGLLFLMLFLWLAIRIQRKKREHRGFEVKLNTGLTPVPEKKDENHG